MSVVAAVSLGVFVFLSGAAVGSAIEKGLERIASAIRNLK